MASNNDALYLEMRFHLSDGSVEHFLQDDETTAQRILQGLRPGQLFKQARIMIAGTYSMTAFVPTHVEKIDFICKDFAHWEFPAGLADVAEISEAQFREHAGLNDSSRLQKRNQPRVVGDPFVSFMDMEMRSGRHIFLMLEGAVGLPAERLNRLQLLLSGMSLHVRLPGSGVGIINLGNLVRFTLNPGPREAPIDAWPAHHQLANLTAS